MKSVALFTKKNLDLLVGLITFLIAMWMILFVIPGLFASLFDTILGNIILIAFISLIAMHDKTLAFGIAVVFIILWRFAYMTNKSILF